MMMMGSTSEKARQAKDESKKKETPAVRERVSRMGIEAGRRDTKTEGAKRYAKRGSEVEGLKGNAGSHFETSSDKKASGGEVNSRENVQVRT